MDRTRDVVTASLLAALLAASAWVSVPLQPVPVTFQTFVVILAALLLRPRWAAAAVGTYLVLGAAGVPVFSGPAGGLAPLVGPTGGYLVGFLVATTTGAWVRVRLARIARAGAADVAGAVVVLAVVYALGWAWLVQVTGLGVGAAFAVGVAPFLPLDAAKAAVAVGAAAALRRSGAVPGDRPGV